jgi:[protein-PII] uridylyltransferase
MTERPRRAAAAREDDGDLAASAAYVESMPRKYRQLFDGRAVASHAAIVARRGEKAAHAEAWKEFPGSGLAICVVSDDAPGLLARIGAALVAHALDVVAAQVYCRRREGTPDEAVDFFWVRRAHGHANDGAPIGAEDVAAVAATLERLVAGHGGLADLHRLAPVRVGVGARTRLGFESDAHDGTTVLTVQGTDRPGLLFALSKALFAEQVRITHSDVATHEGEVLDRFHLTELDGTPLRRARLLGIQTAILAAIDPA